jgi:excisionase family DNA binding protein
MLKLNEASGASQTAAIAPVSPLTKSLLSKRELAAILGISERTIENWVAQKRIPRLQLSARLQRFSLAKVLTALARYEIREVGARR